MEIENSLRLPFAFPQRKANLNVHYVSTDMARYILYNGHIYTLYMYVGVCVYKLSDVSGRQAGSREQAGGTRNCNMCETWRISISMLRIRSVRPQNVTRQGRE